MATIGKITMAASGSAAIDYAYGKGRMPDETKSWLRDRGVDPDTVDQLHDRAVVMDGWNVDPAYAKTQMAATRDAFRTGGKQTTRIIQSFSTDDLDPLNAADWQRANRLGMELAQKAFPDYQVGVYTQLDGVGHKLHNHLVVNEPNLITGQKYREHQSWQRISQLSDDICREHGLSVIDPEKSPAERHTMAERQLESQDAYVWKDDLRGRIDKAMLGSAVNSYESFSETFAASGVIIHKRGQNFSYEFLDVKNKHRRARGKALGRDYESETINHELERPNRQPAPSRPSGNITLEDSEPAIKQRKRDFEQRVQPAEQAQSDFESRKPAITRLEQRFRKLTSKLQSFTEKARKFLESHVAQEFMSKLKHDQSVKAAEKSPEPASPTVASEFLKKLNHDKAQKQKQQRQDQQNRDRERGGLEL